MHREFRPQAVIHSFIHIRLIKKHSTQLNIRNTASNKHDKGLTMLPQTFAYGYNNLTYSIKDM